MRDINLQRTFCCLEGTKDLKISRSSHQRSLLHPRRQRPEVFSLQRTGAECAECPELGAASADPAAKDWQSLVNAVEIASLARLSHANMHLGGCDAVVQQPAWPKGPKAHVTRAPPWESNLGHSPIIEGNGWCLAA